MKKETILNAIAAVCTLLFFYAAVSKLVNYEQSKNEMFKQIFPGGIAIVLTWLLPVMELIVVLLLLFKKTRLKGLYSFLILLVFFTLYIAVAMSGFFGHRPCACGGILKNMGYWEHLALNLFFIVLAIIGVALERRWEIRSHMVSFCKQKGGYRP